MNSDTLSSEALEAFKNITFNAFNVLADVVSSEARVYYSSEPQNNSKVKPFKWKVMNAIFRLSPEKWEEAEKTMDGKYSTRNLLAKRYAEEHPEKADLINGYSELFTAINILRLSCSRVNEKTALSAMKSFISVYQENSNLNDVDLLIGFVKKEHIIKNKYIAAIDKIPPEAKQGINLHIRDTIEKFASKYITEYGIEESPKLGGK